MRLALFSALVTSAWLVSNGAAPHASAELTHAKTALPKMPMAGLQRQVTPAPSGKAYFPLGKTLRLMEEFGLGKLPSLDGTSRKLPAPSSKTGRPYAEYEKAGTIFFSAHSNFSSGEIKEALIRELPQDVNVVIYTDNHASVDTLRRWAHTTAPQTPVEIIVIRLAGEQFWTRDALPVPILAGAPDSPSLEVVDARYYHKFEPDEIVARGFGAPMRKHSYLFEGGNFVADAHGNCFIVDNSLVRKMPDSVFNEFYGCVTLTRFPHLAGIGHVDERVKILSDTLAVTDTPEYVSALENMGFEVRILPQLYPKLGVRTYVNSLLVNGTVFLPIYHQDADERAIQIYEDAGFKVVPLDSRTLSDQGKGSIHCITMTYPPAAFRALP